MSSFIPFYTSSDDNFDYLNDSFDDDTSGNKIFNIILFLILLVIVILFFYFFIWKKYKEYKKRGISKNLNIDLVEKDTQKIDPVISKNDFIDSDNFNFELECSESNCPELRCVENEIILRRRDQCCPECVSMGDQSNNNQDFLKRLKQLNQFVDKNISNIKFSSNLNEIGRNTSKVTFSLIDRLTEFNYKEFNLEAFLKIFTQDNEIIYVGIILFLIGLIIVIFFK